MNMNLNSTASRNYKYFNLDNPNLRQSERIILHISNIAPFFVFAFLGTALITLTYMIFCFYKDWCIAYLRQDEPFERGYYYKLVQYKPFIKPITIFSFIMAIFWFVVLFTKWRFYMLSSGFLIFSLSYLIYLIYYYFICENYFDYFDDLIWIYNKIMKRNQSVKLKKD